MSPSNIKSTTIKWNPIEGKKFLVLETFIRYSPNGIFTTYI